MKIQDLRAREIIDCKGKPLLEVDIITEDGTMGRAASPSGISAGEHEAMVLRDGDQSRYDGNGVRKAVEMAEKVVLPAIQGMDVLDQQALDRRLMELDGTTNKSSSRFRGFCCRGDGFFCGCRLIFFCFMMLRLNGLLYGFTDGNVPALRNPPAAFNIAVYIEFMFHDYTK